MNCKTIVSRCPFLNFYSFKLKTIINNINFVSCLSKHLISWRSVASATTHHIVDIHTCWVKKSTIRTSFLYICLNINYVVPSDDFKRSMDSKCYISGQSSVTITGIGHSGSLTITSGPV